MQGRDFIAYATALLGSGSEVSRRTSAGRSYYGLMLECRDALLRWGFPIPPRENVHSFVRLRLSFAAEPDLKTLGGVLDDLSRLRNEADYHLSSSKFTKDARARQATLDAVAALALLNAIDSDPIRQAAASASIRAVFP